MKPVVALVGRPNVGKSTLFNRITKSRDAIVDDMPGVTRDRHFQDTRWDESEFTLVDTGGFLQGDDDTFAGEIRFQVEQAIEDADIVVVVLDGRKGVSPYDTDLVQITRNSEKTVFYLINKIDGEEQEENLYEFYSLGIDSFFPVSGEHGYGVPDFLDHLVGMFPESKPLETDETIINLAVVGRPNAGKSSLVNKLTGEKRAVVSDVPGTTRDAVDSLIVDNNQTYRLIDTAGIRRKGRVKEKIEKFSIIKALKCFERCDVALIMIDASEGITDQDITVAGYANDRGCGTVFLFNKWDIVDEDRKNIQYFEDALYMQAKFLYFAPSLAISAKTGLRVRKIFNLVNQVYRQYATRIPTGEVNRIIEWATERTPPSLHKNKRLKFYYATQVGEKPPTFVCFVNYPEAVHFSYKRYLLNEIREHAGLENTPIRLYFRQRTGKIDFSEIRDDNKNTRNKGSKDKDSRNKLKKRKKRKIQGRRKKHRNA